jgi:hypothetical protein
MVVSGSGQVAHEENSSVLDLMAEVDLAQRADVAPLAAALTGLGRDASVFAILAATPKSSLGELIARPRLPGSAVALLIRPWTWTGSGRDQIAENAWQSAADSLRASGWRVVPAESGSHLAELWPALLGARLSGHR